MWSENEQAALRERLLSLAEPTYQHFSASLIPAISKDRVLGVRLPALRALARDLIRSGRAEDYLAALPHGTLEEDHIHSFLIGAMPTGKALDAIDVFLPFVDNWAVCDSLRPKDFGRKKDGLAPVFRRWATSEHSYTRRFGIEMLMLHFSGEDPDLVASLSTGEYEVDAMVAWYFATALAHKEEEILPYFHGEVLSPNCRKMAIRKALESRRISEPLKTQLRKKKA